MLSFVLEHVLVGCGELVGETGDGSSKVLLCSNGLQVQGLQGVGVGIGIDAGDRWHLKVSKDTTMTFSFKLKKNLGVALLTIYDIEKKGSYCSLPQCKQGHPLLNSSKSSKLILAFTCHVP
ncbi:hypothetical protein Tco_0970123 [Tanacetum coccineum]